MECIIGSQQIRAFREPKWQKIVPEEWLHELASYPRANTISPEEIDVGDILVFRKNHVIITHRVTKKWISNNTYHFRTKGDSNDIEDSFISEDSDVLGKVEFSIKYIGYPTVLVREFFERSK